MMKKILLLLILGLPALQGKSQVIISLLLGDKLNSGDVEFGLDGGVNYASQSGVKGGSLSEFNLGFYFDIKLKKEPWMIHTGVIVKSNMGAAGIPPYSLNDATLDNLFAGGSVSRKMNYFNVPVLLKRKFKNNLYLEAGPQFGLLYNATDEFMVTNNGQDLIYKVDVRDRFHSLDAGLTTGIGYRLMKGYGINLGVRYYWGFVDIVKDNTGNPIQNRSLYLAIGIPIGVGKSREKSQKKDNP
jgi:hypothetical protein